MTPPISLTSNAAATIMPITDKEAALLADEQHVQQETDDLEHLAEKCKQHEELSDKQKAVQAKWETEVKVRGRVLMEAMVVEVRQAVKWVNE